MIDLQNVSRRYQMGEAMVDALHPTDLRIGPRELVVFLGPSGSGKTTLLNLIGCMDAPSGGSVNVNGVDLSSAGRDQQVTYRRTTVGVVFQFHNLIPNLTARENVELAADLAERNGTSVEDALDQVGLGQRLDHFPHELSGGEQQRVAIARALVKDPPIILGDEPTGNLDGASGKTVLTLFHDIHARGKCVLLVTHNASVARMATRVISMRDGRIRSDVVNERPLHPDEIDW